VLATVHAAAHGLDNRSTPVDNDPGSRGLAAMLFVTIFLVLSGACALTFAMLYNLLPFGGRAAEAPMVLLALGAVSAAVIFLFYRRATGRWPGSGLTGAPRDTRSGQAAGGAAGRGKRDS